MRILPERRWQTTAGAMDAAMAAKRNLSPSTSENQPSPTSKARGRSVPVPRGLEVRLEVMPIMKPRGLSPPMPMPEAEGSTPEAKRFRRSTAEAYHTAAIQHGEHFYGIADYVRRGDDVWHETKASTTPIVYRRDSGQVAE
eukprot:2398331-Prorocentrum_lima.AAC.1